jgi:hypothetical protein
MTAAARALAPQSGPATRAPAPEVYRLPWVEIFATGNHGGEEWDEGDLDEMVANFRRLKGKLDPPLVVGHEEDQQLLDRTDLPAAGWVGDVRKFWDPEDGVWKLGAPVESLPPEVADWVNRGLYRKVSAEIYDSPQQAGLPGTGKTLRRLALLGGELPKVKTLRALPFAVRAARFSEGRVGPRRPRVLRFSGASRPAAEFRRISFFSERRNVDRTQLSQAALQMGLSQAVIDLLDDNALAAVVQDLQGKQAAPGPAPAVNAEPDPNDPATVCAEGGPGDPARPGGPAPDPANMMAALGSPAQIIAKYSELARKFDGLQRDYQTLSRKIGAREVIEAERSQQAHAANVKAFCERMKTAKKVLHFEIDPEGDETNLYHQLLRASPERVHKFSEGGKAVQKSELELQMAAIDKRDPALIARMFSEKMPHPQPGGQGGALSPERRKELLGSTPLGAAILRQPAAK